MRTIPKPLNSLVIFLAEFFFAAAFSLILSIITRYFILPTSTYKQYPLNIVFNTCDHDLHGVCSFPTAALSFNQNELFSPGVYYAVNIRLKFAEISTTTKLGLFQNVITIFDKNEKVLKQLTKSAYLKERGFLTKSMYFVFFPLYVVGVFTNSESLEIPMTTSYLEDLANPSTKLVYTLQDKFANVEEAELFVSAQFGIIRHIAYYWPVTTYILLVIFYFSCFLLIFILKWALCGLVWGPREQAYKVVGDCPTVPTSLVSNGKEAAFADDEFKPDNVGELPDCDVLHATTTLNKLRENVVDTLRRRK